MHVASFDKTRTGVVLGVDDDTQLYTIKVDGVTYSNIKATGGVIPEVGDTVSVIFPTNNTSQMVINGSSSNSWANGVPNIIYDIVPNLVLELIYPVGAYYWSSDADFDPNEAFVGTWELLDEGIALVSAGETYVVSDGTGRDGGSEYIQEHKHSVDTQPAFTIPNHTHTWTCNKDASSELPGSNPKGRGNVIRDGSGNSWTTGSTGGGGGCNRTDDVAVGNVDDLPAGQITGDQGNMPPYKCAYCWHRTL